jgi:excisionase family DNA binding protein
MDTLGRTKIYELIGSGELPAIKVGRRTYIRTAEAEAWLEACQHYAATPGRTAA